MNPNARLLANSIQSVSKKIKSKPYTIADVILGLLYYTRTDADSELIIDALLSKSFCHV